jgi:hypothetical protein
VEYPEPISPVRKATFRVSRAGRGQHESRWPCVGRARSVEQTLPGSRKNPGQSFEQTLEKRLVRSPTSVVTTVMITAAIKEAMMPYSTAVAPRSLRETTGADGLCEQALHGWALPDSGGAGMDPVPPRLPFESK